MLLLEREEEKTQWKRTESRSVMCCIAPETTDDNWNACKRRHKTCGGEEIATLESVVCVLGVVCCGVWCCVFWNVPKK